MKLKKNVKVNFAGKTFRNEVPDRVVEALKLDEKHLDGLQQGYDEKKKKADAANKKNEAKQVKRASDRAIEKATGRPVTETKPEAKPEAKKK